MAITTIIIATSNTFPSSRPRIHTKNHTKSKSIMYITFTQAKHFQTTMTQNHRAMHNSSPLPQTWCNKSLKALHKSKNPTSLQQPPAISTIHMTKKQPMQKKSCRPLQTSNRHIKAMQKILEIVQAMSY